MDFDFGPQRSVVRGDADPRTVQRPSVQDTGAAGAEDAIQWQEWTAYRKRGRRRTFVSVPQNGTRQRGTAPGAPFVQIATQDSWPRGPATQMLPQRPHLRDPQHLRQRQMRSHDPQRAPVAAELDNDGAPVAIARQVDNRDGFDIDRLSSQEKHPEKAVTFAAPTAPSLPLDMTQARARLDIRKIEDAPVRHSFFVSFLENDKVGWRRNHVPDQNIGRSDGIDHAVLATSPMNVPADDRKAGHRFIRYQSMRRCKTSMDPPYSRSCAVLMSCGDLFEGMSGRHELLSIHSAAA